MTRISLFSNSVFTLVVSYNLTILSQVCWLHWELTSSRSREFITYARRVIVGTQYLRPFLNALAAQQYSSSWWVPIICRVTWMRNCGSVRDWQSVGVILTWNHKYKQQLIASLHFRLFCKFSKWLRASHRLDTASGAIFAHTAIASEQRSAQELWYASEVSHTYAQIVSSKPQSELLLIAKNHKIP